NTFQTNFSVIYHDILDLFQTRVTTCATCLSCSTRISALDAMILLYFGAISIGVLFTTLAMSFIYWVILYLQLFILITLFSGFYFIFLYSFLRRCCKLTDIPHNIHLRVTSC